MIKNYKHKTVLLNEAVNGLNIQIDGNYIDGTFGYGGHSKLILSKLGKKGRLLAIDRDPTAVNIAKTITDPRFTIIHGPFSLIDNYVSKFKLTKKINGILFDLGTSSLQLKNAKRGFSFMLNGPLDMRMDPTHGKSVAEWLKTAKEEDIRWVIKNFGEERFAKKIAQNIYKYNKSHSIIYTQDLVKLITSLNLKNKFKHPATRTFQALRIFINNELKEIELALENSMNLLAPKGRLSIISFHSLEDRIVKNFMIKKSVNLDIPVKLPITEKEFTKINKSQLRILGKFIPSKYEILNNPSSRSAILRIAERIYL